MTPSPRRMSVQVDRRFHRGDLRAVRRRRAGQMIWRALRRVTPVVLGLAAVAGLGAAVMQSSVLAITEIRVHGGGRLSAADLQTRVADLRGQNILRVDFETTRRRVLDSRWVADVTFGRVLPSTIELYVTERAPIALARLDQQLYLMDAAGVIIDEFGPEHYQFDLPIVDGLFVTGDGEAPTLDPERVRLVARLLRALAPVPGIAGQVSQVDVSNSRDAAVLLADDPAWLHVGQQDFAPRLTTYRELAEALHSRLPGLESVDLRFDERIYVRTADTRAGR